MPGALRTIVKRRCVHCIKLINNVSNKFYSFDAFCIYLCVALSCAPISFSNSKSLTFHGRIIGAYSYNRYCCIYALLPNWNLFSCFWTSNAMIRNVYMMTRCSSRSYIRRSSHNSCTKISPNRYGFIYCFRGYVLLCFFLSFLSFINCTSNSNR